MAPTWGQGGDLQKLIQQQTKVSNQLLQAVQGYCKPCTEWQARSDDGSWACFWDDCEYALANIANFAHRPICHKCKRVKYMARSPPKERDVRLLGKTTLAKQQMRSLQEGSAPSGAQTAAEEDFKQQKRQ